MFSYVELKLIYEALSFYEISCGNVTVTHNGETANIADLKKTVNYYGDILQMQERFNEATKEDNNV